MPKSKHRSTSPRKRSHPCRLSAEQVRNIDLPLQNALSMIELGHGTEEHWHSLAAGVSLGQDLARVRRDETAATYLDLAADALNEITGRHARVGGRWGAQDTEIVDLRNGLTIVRTLCMLSNSAQAIPAIQRVTGMPIGTLLKVVKAREAVALSQSAGDQ